MSQSSLKEEDRAELNASIMRLQAAQNGLVLDSGAIYELIQQEQSLLQRIHEKYQEQITPPFPPQNENGTWQSE